MAAHPPPETGTERRSARRGWGLALLTLAAALGGVLIAALWVGRDEFSNHQAYLLGDADARVALNYAALSPAMDEAALQRHVAPATLRCRDAEDSGTRVCEAALAQAGSVAAARLRATLGQGRLQQLDVFVPWWAHHGAARALTAQQGAPFAIDRPEPGDDQAERLVWPAAAGSVRLARSPGWNPWRWSVLRWSASTPR